MILPLFLLVQSLIDAPPKDGEKVCLGVAVNTPKGEAKLVFLTLNGAASDIKKVKAAAKPLNIDFVGPNEDDGKVTLGFSSRVKSEDAARLYREIVSGKFGQFERNPWIVPLDPADPCPRLPR